MRSGANLGSARCLRGEHLIRLMSPRSGTSAVKIPITWRYLLAFYYFGALMGMSHELAHHAAGFAVGGEWGYKTFNPLVYGLLFLVVPITVFYLVGIVLEDLINKPHVLSDTVWGIPYMVLLAEVVATIGYSVLKLNLWRPADDAQRRAA